MPPRRTLSTPTMILLAVVAIGFLAMPFLPDPREDWRTREARYSTPQGLARSAEVALATMPRTLDLAAPSPAWRVVVTSGRVDVDDIGWFLSLSDSARDAVEARGSAEVTAEGVKTVVGVPDKQVGVDRLDGSGGLPGLAAAAARHRALQRAAGDEGIGVNVLFDVSTPGPQAAAVLSTLQDAGFERADAVVAVGDTLAVLPISLVAPCPALDDGRWTEAAMSVAGCAPPVAGAPR